MEEELGGAVCDFCGDAGGASALILCENSHLGCLGGRHLYCFLPVKRELGQEEFFCEMCCAHRTREAAAKTRAEEAAAAAAAVEAAQLPPPKRQRVESRASQSAAPQRAGAAAALVARPVAAASRGTLSLALEGIEDDAVRRGSVIDGTYRSQHGPRELPSLSWQYTLANIVAGGALWSGSVGIPMSIAPSSQVRATCYPMPENPFSEQAAAYLPANLQGPHEFITLEKQGLRDVEDVYRNASIVLAYGGAEEGRVQAGDQDAASWCRLWNAMQSGRLALKLELEQDVALLLFINERAPPAMPGQPTGTLLGLLAAPLPSPPFPRHRLVNDRGEPQMPRGILKKEPGQRKKLVWSERPLEAGKLSFCELGPGSHYSAPQAEFEAPVQPPEERPAARPGALTSGQELPLQGVRISLLAYQVTTEVAQLLNELRQLGAATFPRPLPGCEDLVIVHPRKVAEGLQQSTEIDIAACLAADPYLLVYEGLDALYHMLRTQARLRLGDCEHCQLFPRGCVVVVDGAAAQAMQTNLLEVILEDAAARLARDPAAKTLLLIAPEDMKAWQGWVAAGNQTAAENLALWSASTMTKTMGPKDMSSAVQSDVSPLVRHAVKIAHNARKSWRHVYLLTENHRILEEASHQTTIHSGGAEDYLEFVSSAAGA